MGMFVALRVADRSADMDISVRDVRNAVSGSKKTLYKAM
jgi:hypothetical protein